MTLIFGQFPQRAFATGQFVLHAIVGSVADPIPPIPPIPPTPPLVFPRGYILDWDDEEEETKPKVLIRRDKVGEKISHLDEDAIAALAVFMLLETQSDL